MKIKALIDTEEVGDDKELLLLAMRHKFFNFAFDLAINFDNTSSQALGVEVKDSFSREDVVKIIAFALSDNGIAPEVIEEIG